MLDIARGIWLEHRYNRIEQEVIQIRRESLSAADLDKPLGHIYLQDTSNVLGKIESRRNTARRRADRAKRELLNLQIQRSFIEHPPVRVIPQEVKQLPANPVRFEKSPQPVISVAAPSPKPAATASAFAPKQELGNPALRL
jgi:cell division septation protein DedD